jgi:SNF2 family DNA or RNA helicase
MGLGKTVQAIAVAVLLAAGKDTPAQPTLVVMPKSLLGNWHRELAAALPTAKVAVYPDDGEEAAAAAQFVLVSYPRLRLAKSWAKGRVFELVILDEAQAIKNRGSQTAQAVRALTSNKRLVLTGTPIENHVGELWSLVDWLNPEYLGPHDDFVAYVRQARAGDTKAAMLAPIREVLAPILLRRTKSDPATRLDLPPKIYEDLEVELTDEQTAVYREILSVALGEELQGLSRAERSALFLKTILFLKQVCNHPDVFYADAADEDDESRRITASVDDARLGPALRARLAASRGSKRGARGAPERSGKLTALLGLLEQIEEEGRGTVIFTQSLAMAEILRDAVAATGTTRPPLLSGVLDAAARLAMVDAFNLACTERERAEAVRAKTGNETLPRLPILVASLRAGGTGLNVTGADHVIHYDRWWNPAVEDQATDRAHRIGQTRTVMVHTLTSMGTIEATIASIFEDKRALAADFLAASAVAAVEGRLGTRRDFLGLVDPLGTFSSPEDRA